MVLVLLGVPAGLWLNSELRRADLGGPCERDPDCHSGLCLHPMRPSRFASAPHPSRAVAPGASACTRPCKTDAECPSTFTCADAVSHDVASFRDRGVEVRVCVRR